MTTEQLAFVETFVRCEGKLNRMERIAAEQAEALFRALEVNS